MVAWGAAEVAVAARPCPHAPARPPPGSEAMRRARALLARLGRSLASSFAGEGAPASPGNAWVGAGGGAAAAEAFARGLR